MQSEALEMLIFMDRLEASNKRRDAVKMALISNGEWKHDKLFPEYFETKIETEEDEEKAEAAGEAVNYDYSGVKWLGADDAKDQYAELMAKLREGSEGSITGDDVIAAQNEWV